MRLLGKKAFPFYFPSTAEQKQGAMWNKKTIGINHNRT